MTTPGGPTRARQRHRGEVRVGDELTSVSFPLTVYRLVMEAGANRDLNSIHHNTEYARATGADEMYANASFLLGMWERTVRDWIGPGGTIHSIRGFRMRTFTYAGDTAIVSGRVIAISGDIHRDRGGHPQLHERDGRPGCRRGEPSRGRVGHMAGTSLSSARRGPRTTLSVMRADHSADEVPMDLADAVVRVRAADQDQCVVLDDARRSDGRASRAEHGLRHARPAVEQVGEHSVERAPSESEASHTTNVERPSRAHLHSDSG